MIQSMHHVANEFEHVNDYLDHMQLSFIVFITRAACDLNDGNMLVFSWVFMC